MDLYGIRQLTGGKRAVRASTIQIAEDIPESSYTFRPTPRSRSVAETLVHIARLWTFDKFMHEEAHIETLEGFDFIALIEKSALEEQRERSKADIVELLRTGGEHNVRWVEQLPEALLREQMGMPGGGSASRFEMLLCSKEHEMHHQAQLTVFERLLDIIPHSTRNLMGAKAA